MDIVIENAGVATTKYRSTKDGWEETYAHSPFPPCWNSRDNCSLQVNALSTFLLAFLLLPLLRKTTKISTTHPRLVIVSSELHAWNDIPNYRDEPNILKAMNDQQKHEGRHRYPQTKLLDTLLTRELGKKLESSSHPEDKQISLSG